MIDVSEVDSIDETDVQTSVRRLVEKKDERRRDRESRAAEAEVRRSIKIAERAIAGLHEADPLPLLEVLHEFLWADDRRGEVLLPGFDGLDQQTKVQFRRMNDLLDDERYPDPMTWLVVLEDVAIAMGFFDDPTDKTKYAPVRFDRLDQPGARTLVDEVTPVGRLRLAHDSAATIEDRVVELPIKSCEHVLTVALPRKGKDSTNARVCGNLKDEHGYKWVSILDDGRNELPMIAIPSDDDGVRENLNQMGQTPKAYDTEVFVPAMRGLPDELPANHRPFTIGLESLTPELILRLGGIRSINTNTESRISRALQKTLSGTGAVDSLVDRLEHEAGEMEATIQITELKDDDEDSDGVREITYTMDEDSAMKEAAQAVARLAADGLIEDAGVETNLDIEAIIRRNEKVAVLNCNFLESGDQALRYVIMDMWMQLLYRARKRNSRLPRIALEIRELKNLAPSKLVDVKYKDAIKATRQTLYTLASQGSAERVMIVGSTQKLNEVYKAVRNNMLIKILLQSGDEQIDALANTYNFTHDEEEQLGSFQVGWGMVVRPEQRDWPVQLCAARCGLGQGDRHWLDRYGIAWGARVRESTRDQWSSRFSDAEWWVEVNDILVYDAGTEPTVGDYYSQWYLLDRDFPERTTRDDVDGELVEQVLESRREYTVPSDLSMRSVRELQRSRTAVYRDLDEAQEERLEERLEEHNVPTVLHAWTTKQQSKRSRMLDILKVVRDEDVSRYPEITEKTGIARSTISGYMQDNSELAACIVDDEDLGRYALTPIGEKALELPWARIVGDE